MERIVSFLEKHCDVEAAGNLKEMGNNQGSLL
jgi:hypothetical protein